MAPGTGPVVALSHALLLVLAALGVSLAFLRSSAEQRERAGANEGKAMYLGALDDDAFLGPHPDAHKPLFPLEPR